MPMTGNIDRVEVITSVQRRRRWSAEEKAQIVQETPACCASSILGSAITIRSTRTKRWATARRASSGTNL